MTMKTTSGTRQTAALQEPTSKVDAMPASAKISLMGPSCITNPAPAIPTRNDNDTNGMLSQTSSPTTLMRPAGPALVPRTSHLSYLLLLAEVSILHKLEPLGRSVLLRMSTERHTALDDAVHAAPSPSAISTATPPVHNATLLTNAVLPTAVALLPEVARCTGLVLLAEAASSAPRLETCRRSMPQPTPIVHYPAAMHEPEDTEDPAEDTDARPGTTKSTSGSVKTATVAPRETGGEHIRANDVKQIGTKAKLHKVGKQDETAATKTKAVKQREGKATEMKGKGRATAHKTKQAAVSRTTKPLDPTTRVAASNVVEAPLEEPSRTTGKRKRVDEPEPESAVEVLVEVNVVNSPRPKRIRKPSRKACSPDNVAATFKLPSRMRRGK